MAAQPCTRYRQLVCVSGVALCFTLAAVVLVPGAAASGPRSATIRSTGALHKHVSASWSLPSGVSARVIAVATKPDTGADGALFDENVVIFDLLQPSQTTYVATEQLDPGTYYVRVGTFDNDCSYLENNTCYAWSQTGQVTIAQPANVRPTLKFVKFLPYLTLLRVKTCDDSTGTMTYRLTLSQTTAGHTAIGRRAYRSASPTLEEWKISCETYDVPMPNRPSGVGRYKLVVAVTDAHGVTSKPLVRRWFTSD